MKALALILGLTVTSISPTFAASQGGDSGGGGDSLEGRVNEIRSDLLTWIQKGGAQELNLPADISYGEYVDKMSEILVNKKVALSFTDRPVTVAGKDKTCRGLYITKTKGLFGGEKISNPEILCNIKRFKETEASAQYPLIHHEYAGLVNIEKNNGSASDYEISNQITEFLENHVVKKLVVKKKPTPKVAPKYDPTLEKINKERINVTAIENAMPSCRPFYQQMEKEWQEKVNKSYEELLMHDLTTYYEKNQLSPISEVNIVSINVTSAAIKIIANVTAGADSTQIRLEQLPDYRIRYKTYSGSISNYVDKLGRVQKVELECSIENSYDYGGNLGRRDHEVYFYNNPTGYELKMPKETRRSGYAYEYAFGTSVEITKEITP